MPDASQPALTIDQLQRLSNDAEATRRELASVVASLAGSEEQAQWACEALENCGQPPVSALAVLATYTGHPDELVASWACKLLGRLGTAAGPAEKELVSALHRQSQPLVREEAARALGELQNLSAASRDALAAAATEGSPRLKRLATASLGG